MFAGRAFRKGEVVVRSCMTLFLPGNFPQAQAVWHYAFGYNKTHIALDLDHGSIFNHLENANTEARRLSSDKQSKVYQVRRQCENRNTLQMHAPYLHTRARTQRMRIRTHTHMTFSRPQKISRRGRNFSFGTGARSGLQLKI